MNKQEVTQKVIELLKSRGNIKAESSEQFLKEDLDMESLDVIELDMDCEKEFNISIRDWDADNWKTVSDVVETVFSLVSKKEFPPLV